MSETAVAVASHPLRNARFRLLWIGNTISWTGDQFYLVALPWLILQLTGSAIVLGTVTMVAAVPRAALMLLGGALTDRFSPRKIMMLTASARAVLVAAISVLLWGHRLQIWHLYVLALGFGTADAFAGPAAQAFLPSLVPAEQLPAANSISQSTALIATLVAPAPAGIFIKAFGTAWALFLDAVSFLFILGALWRLPDPPAVETGEEQRNVMRSIVDGLRYVSRDGALSALMLVVAVLNFAISGPAGVGIPFLVKQKFGSASSFGLLLAAIAAGSLAGMLLAGFFKPRQRGRLLLLVSIVIGLCVAALGQLNRMPWLASDLFLMGGAAAFLNLSLLVWFQQRVERAMMGRVMSVLMFASLGLTPFSLAIAGVLLKWSVPGMFWLAGASVLAITLVAATRRQVWEID
jgi:Transmembrane secretion effector